MRRLDKRMAAEHYKRCFGGVLRLYGAEQMEILRSLHVCIIGVGGVGSWAVEALARTGIGNLTLIDMDDICVTNTNRQIHAISDTIGKSKIEIMKKRVELINPDCKVHLVDDFLSPENQKEYLTKDYDYVLDAIDSARIKAALLAHCRSNKIRVITIGSAGGKTDPTKVSVTDLTKTVQDPLARKVKIQLKRFYRFPKRSTHRLGIDCVFSSEPLKYPQLDGSVCYKKPKISRQMRLDCTSGLGTSIMVTATFGLVAAARIVEKLLLK